MYTVSITSQGQITIPAPIRRKLGLNKSSKATATLTTEGLMLKPKVDFLTLGGSLVTNKKPISGNKIREMFLRDRSGKLFVKSK